mmetsp:Transcript_41294/g.113880  ORF Transcript_41294/g.113880 Transcript_41294/m.113880 type:complete len:140 (-) Transcript_41294:209-628(-)
MIAFSVASTPCICAAAASWAGGVSAAATATGSASLSLGTLFLASEFEQEKVLALQRSGVGADAQTKSPLLSGGCAEEDNCDVGAMVQDALSNAAESLGGSLDTVEQSFASGIASLAGLACGDDWKDAPQPSGAMAAAKA